MRQLLRVFGDCVFVQEPRVVALMRRAEGARGLCPPGRRAAQGGLQTVDAVAAVEAAVGGGEGREAVARRGAVLDEGHLPLSAAEGEAAGRRRQAEERRRLLHAALQRPPRVAASQSPARGRGSVERRNFRAAASARAGGTGGGAEAAAAKAAAALRGPRSAVAGRRLRGPAAGRSAAAASTGAAAQRWARKARGGGTRVLAPRRHVGPRQ